MLRLLVLFFASGCAVLIYETVWFYLVQLVVGASSVTLSLLLCKASSAIPLALPYIQRVYLTLAEPGAGAITLRALVCFLVLTPPTMLMGATLPAIARWKSREHDAESIGLLYMANLAGGATGTVLAGFYLLRVFDTVTATAVAVVLNLIVAAAFWYLARQTSAITRAETEMPGRDRAVA